MPIPVACPCGAKFNAKDELAGKAVRCPKCKQPLKIPVPQAAPASSSAMDDLFDEVGIKPKQGPVCLKCGAEMKPNAVLCVACGFNVQTGEVAKGVKVSDRLGGHEESAEAVLAQAARQIEIDKDEDRKNKSSGSPAYVYIFGLLALAAFAGMMFTLPKGLAFFITGCAIVGFASLISSYYGLRMWIAAFQESAAQGFLHLVPFYNIYYLITRWKKVGPFFMKQLGTIPLMLFGGALMGLGYLLGFERAEEDEAAYLLRTSIEIVQAEPSQHWAAPRAELRREAS
jgi:hypothetical protein